MWATITAQTEVSNKDYRDILSVLGHQSGFIICCTGSFFMELIEPVALYREPEQHCQHSSAQLPYLESFFKSTFPLSRLVPRSAAVGDLTPPQNQPCALSCFH